MQRVEEERGGGGGGGTTRAPRAVPGAAVLLLSPPEPPRGSRHASLDSTAETQVCPTGELPLCTACSLPAPREPPAVPQIICSAATPGPELLLPIARPTSGLGA